MRRPSDIREGPAGQEAAVLQGVLRRLLLLGDDPFLAMQATNVAIVDAWLTGVEGELARECFAQEGTPLPLAVFVSAQSQMWLFALYELLRTWRSRAKDALKLAANGGLSLKMAALRKATRFRHLSAEVRSHQLERLERDPRLLAQLDADLRRSHIPFRRLEAIRISLAKHEVVGHPNTPAFAPGYGRIDHFTGSIRYEISSGANIFDEITRRHVADELRSLCPTPPTQEDLDAFDHAMRAVLSGRDPSSINADR